MTESAADCRPVPFASVFLIAVIAIGSGVYIVPEGFHVGALGHPAVAGFAIYMGATMLVTCYVDAFRSRCLRRFVNIGLILLALACAVPFIGTARSAWGGLQQAAVNTLYLLGALFVILHFSLHNMPSQWRAALTPRSTGLIAVAVMIGVALYRNATGGVETLADLDQFGVEAAGIAVGGFLCALMMRHRGRGAEG